MGIAIRIHKDIYDIHYDEESELNAESKKVAYDVGDGHDQSWEINLAEYAGVVHEGVGCISDTVRKVMPQTGTGEVEQRSGNSVGRNACDTSEYDHVRYDREGGLYNEPDRPQDGLLVLCDDVALDEQTAEVTVAP